MRRKIVKVPIYGGRLVLIEDKDFTEVDRKYNLKDTSGYDAFVFCRDYSSSVDYIMVFRTDKIYGSIIAHESVHISNYIFQCKGISPDLVNDEPQAYLVGWVYKQAEKFLNKK